MIKLENIPPWKSAPKPEEVLKLKRDLFAKLRAAYLECSDLERNLGINLGLLYHLLARAEITISTVEKSFSYKTREYGSIGYDGLKRLYVEYMIAYELVDFSYEKAKKLLLKCCIENSSEQLNSV